MLSVAAVHPIERPYVHVITSGHSPSIREPTSGFPGVFVSSSVGDVLQGGNTAGVPGVPGVLILWGPVGAVPFVSNQAGCSWQPMNA